MSAGFFVLRPSQNQQKYPKELRNSWRHRPEGIDALKVVV